jgi:hypothetical protein
MKLLLRITPAIVLIPLLTACASAQAKGTDAPTLDVPPPPPHVVEIAAEPLEPVGEIPNPNTPAPARPGRPATRETAPKPDAAKPEPPKADAPASAPAPPPENPAPVAPPPPNPQLLTQQPADTSTAAKKVRTTIDGARSTLNGVNYGPLSNERKKAYDDAKRFIDQAETALKEGNIVLAQAVATKAETLAHELAGR